MALSFYLGDTHIHSTVSDGLLSPAALSRTIAGKGLDFCAITDHHNVQGALVTRHQLGLCGLPFTVLTGQEVQTQDHVHFVFLGVPISFPRMRLEHVGDVADYAHAQGGVVVLAHPWTAFDKSAAIIDALDDLFASGRIDAMEVFTSSLKQKKFENWYRMADHYQKVWRLANPAVLASSDWHHRGHGLSIGMGQTYIKAESLSEPALLAAVMARRTVASVSPVLGEEASMFRLLEDTILNTAADERGLKWQGTFFGPADLIAELCHEREFARNRLLAEQSAPLFPEQVARAAGSAFAAGNYSRASQLLALGG